MAYGPDDFDFYEKADACECRFSGDSADASACEVHGYDPGEYGEPDNCRVRRDIVMKARNARELREGLRAHEREYCETCGQTEFIEWRKAA